MNQTGKVNSIIKLGRLATAIQKKPRSDESNAERFLFHLAVDQLQLAVSRGILDREYTISSICGEIDIQGSRRASGSKGFWSSRLNRKDSQTISNAIQEFAECFYDEYWVQDCKSKMPNSKFLKADSATYRYVFTHYSSIDDDNTSTITE